MSLVCSNCLNQLGSLRLDLLLRLHCLLVLGKLELTHCVEELYDSSSGNDLKLSLMLFIVSSWYASSHEPKLLLLQSLQSQFILPFLVLRHLLRWSLVL